MRNNILFVVVAVLFLASCASKKSVSDRINDVSVTAATPEAAFVQKVINGAVTSENIVGNGNITLKFGTKNITVPGALRMRKDKVIRLQLFIPILGTEVGRLEFTPDYVLVVDRLNKQYIKGDYNQLDFLRNNGITFYSLQALFWNQLMLPGKQAVNMSDAAMFGVDLSGNTAQVPMNFGQGNMKYNWNASRMEPSLTSAIISYNSASAGTSMLSWLYSNFMLVDKKKFPRTQEFSFQTTIKGNRQQGEIKINLDDVKTLGDWETETSVSSKYKEVRAEDILQQLMNF